ncbi:MAG: hypothetical protein DRP56_07040 [Planctomycetota bacterium]|nr:MAG: hypothetical protein DRP56_07040 [Planctomycetota bacterium]
MTISAGDILTRAENITKRGFTSASQIAAELMDILVDLSLQGPFLEASTSGTVALDAKFISVPSDAGFIDCIHFDDYILYEQPLQDVLLRRVDGFAVKNGQIFICPVSSSARDYTLYYGKEHNQSTTTIEYEDKYEAAIVHGVASKIFARFSIYDKSKAQMELYQMEIERHKTRLRV